MKVTVQTEDGEIEVEHTELGLPDGAQVIEPDESPDGYVTKEFHQSQLDQAKEGLRKPEEIIGDDELFRRAASRRGYEVNEDGKIVDAEGSEVDLDKAKENWRQDELEPVKQELEKKDNQLQTFKSRTLRGSLVEAGKEVGVEDWAITAPDDGMKPPIVNSFSDHFAWDEENEQWAVVDDNGNFKMANNPTKEKPHAGPTDFLKTLRDNPQYDHMFKDERPGDTGLGDASPNGEGKPVYSRSEIESMDEETYAENREKILKAEEDGRIREG